jgi:hypothetical protein
MRFVKPASHTNQHHQGQQAHVELPQQLFLHITAIFQSQICNFHLRYVLSDFVESLDLSGLTMVVGLSIIGFIVCAHVDHGALVTLNSYQVSEEKSSVVPFKGTFRKPSVREDMHLNLEASPQTLLPDMVVRCNLQILVSAGENTCPFWETGRAVSARRRLFSRCRTSLPSTPYCVEFR